MHFRSAQGEGSVRLRGTNQQTTTGLLHVNALLSGRSTDTGTGGAKRVQGYNVQYARLLSRNASNVMSWGVRIPNWQWKAGLWADGTTTFTDDTTDWQDTDTNDFSLGTDATNNDGFVVLSNVLFNAVTINVSTASSGGSQVAAVSYSKGDGNWSSAMTNLWRQDGSGTFYGTGENIIYFNEPIDWGKTTGAEGTNIPSGMYAIRVRATTAATVAALGKAGEVWRLWMPTNIGADTVEDFHSSEDAFAAPYGDALHFYGDVITKANVATLSFSPGSAQGG